MCKTANGFTTILTTTLLIAATAVQSTPLKLKSVDALRAQILDVPDIELVRSDRSTSTLSALELLISAQQPMCSAAMGNLTRLANFAGALLIEDFTSRRMGRAAAGKNEINQHPGKFCKGLWRRLQRVYLDVLIVEADLERSHSQTRVKILIETIDQLKESLEEQMNLHNVPFAESRLHKAMNVRQPKNAGERSHIKSRAETGLDHIITRLANVNSGCQRWKRSVLKKKRTT